MKLIFLALSLLLCPGAFAETHQHEHQTAAKAKCDCPPDCHCKQPGGTCPKDGPCVKECDCDAPKTYKSDDSQVGRYATGYVKPLTFEQTVAQKEMDSLHDAGEISYDYDVSQVGQHATGFVKPPGVTIRSESNIGALAVHQMAKDGEPVGHKPLDMRELLGNKTPKILNQGNCGSCVVFSFTANAQWSMSLRGETDLPDLSAQHLMNCGGQAGQCSGDYGERVAGRLIKLGELASNADYPYTARNGNCKDTSNMKKFGQFRAWKTIPGTFQSIVEALNNRQPVSVGVAADNRFSSYRSGVYNGFGSMGTNHYVMIVGATCGSSVDAEGNCLFNSKGQLVNGNHEGNVIVANSWGENWGDGGYITMQFENKAGKRNNNIAGGEGNAQVIDTGLPWTPPEPVTFAMGSDIMDLTVTVQPKSVLTVDTVKGRVQAAMDSMSGKPMKNAASTMEKK